jgi:hypothetical protein
MVVSKKVMQLAQFDSPAHFLMRNGWRATHSTTTVEGSDDSDKDVAFLDGIQTIVEVRFRGVDWESALV